MSYFKNKVTQEIHLLKKIIIYWHFQQKNSNLERKIAQLTEQNNQYTLKISELLQNLTTITSRNKDLEEKLSLEQTRYSSLDKEQEELLIELAKTELENANLKERLSLLNNS